MLKFIHRLIEFVHSVSFLVVLALTFIVVNPTDSFSVEAITTSFSWLGVIAQILLGTSLYGLVFSLVLFLVKPLSDVTFWFLTRSLFGILYWFLFIAGAGPFVLVI